MNSNLFETVMRKTRQMICSERFIHKHRIGNGFTRNRKLSFPQLIYFILASGKKSIGVNWSDISHDFPSLNLPSVSKQAISKARQKVSSDACLELCQLFSKIFYKYDDAFSLWNGYHIYAVDGSTIQIPPSEENINFWGSNPNQYGKDEPLASVSLLYDVMNDLVIDSYIGKYRLNERDAAERHLDFFTGLHLPGKHIFLFDRGYPSYDLFSKLMTRQLFFLMRLPSSFKNLINKEKEDILVQYQPKGRKLPLRLRCIHVQLPDGSMEYLVTNITDTAFTVNTFRELYFLRWGIEGRYKEIKVSFQLEAFSGYKPEIIKQDFYSTVFLSNLSALIKNMADTRLKSNVQNKHKYQVNRNFIIGKIKRNIISFLIRKRDTVSSIISAIIEEAVRNRSLIRPGRQYPRHKKYTRRKCYMNDKY